MDCPLHKGRAAEHLFVSAAIYQKWEVHRPMVDTGYDFLVGRQRGSYERVQVKYCTAEGEIRLRVVRDRKAIPYGNDKFDLLGIVVENEVYLLEREDWEGKKSISKPHRQFPHRRLFKR